MAQKTIYAVAAISIAMAAAGAAAFSLSHRSPHPMQTPLTTGPLPELAFKDMAGSSVSLSSLRGRVVVLDLWATWCALCARHLSYAPELQKEFGDEVAIMEVDRGESPESVKNYLNQNHINNTAMIFFDTNDALYPAVNGFLMPETIFIDKEGSIVDHTRGPLDIIEMRRHVQDSFGL